MGHNLPSWDKAYQSEKDYHCEKGLTITEEVFTIIEKANHCEKELTIMKNLPLYDLCTVSVIRILFAGFSISPLLFS